jgi:uracil-DNA glycosylase family 4
MTDELLDQVERLHQNICACTRCVDAGYLAEANPVFRGNACDRRMIVGQAPGPRAHEAGVPWSGASGTLLRKWFARAGFDPDRFLDDWYFTSLPRCFPGKARAGPGDRVPSMAERRLCRPWLDAEIALLQPSLIVTLGRLAANAIIPDVRSLTLRDLVGSVHLVDLGYGKVPVVPLPHPSGVGRWLNDPANRALVDQSMDRLGSLGMPQGAHQ